MTDELPVLLFATPAELEAWLERNHDSSEGVWLKIAKKGVEPPSVTYSEALVQQLGVMDSTAFSLCMDNKMPIVVFDFFRVHNLRRVVAGEKVGTLVTG